MHNGGLGHWLPRRRATAPDGVAIIADDASLTYGQLADMADAVAAALAARGIGKGDAVAFMGENSPEFVAALFGTVRVGAVFVPVNTRLATPEVAHVLTDSEARLLIHDAPLAERAEAAAAAGGIADVVVNAADLTGSGSGGVAPTIAEVSADDPAAIIYTSGTTGIAKGAVLTHANLTWVAINCIIDYDVVAADIALMISPLFHVASLGMGALPVLLKGGTLVLERGFEPGRALAQIERHQVTMLSGVPTTFQLMADHPTWDSTDLSSLTKLTCGGSPAPSRIIDAFEARGLGFSQGYGMTETSPGATALPAAWARQKHGGVGFPHFFTDVRVMGEDGHEAPTGEVGEVQIKGPTVFAGYYGQPEATAAAFTDDGWFRSGDLGYLDADGCLFIAGRAKDLIISGGENIYPAEVENHLLSMPGITGVAIVGVDDEKWGEVPVAVVTVGADAVVDTDSVRAFLDGKVARYKLPKHVVVVDDLPRTATGKVRKAEVREQLNGS
jgi:fatty-acyl-CoA synthase